MRQITIPTVVVVAVARPRPTVADRAFATTG